MPFISAVQTQVQATVRPGSAAAAPRARCPQRRGAAEPVDQGAADGLRPRERPEHARPAPGQVVVVEHDRRHVLQPHEREHVARRDVRRAVLRRDLVDPGNSLVARWRVRRDVTAGEVLNQKPVRAPARSSCRRACRTGAAGRSRRGRCSSCRGPSVKSAGTCGVRAHAPQERFGTSASAASAGRPAREPARAEARRRPERDHHRGGERREQHQPDRHHVPEERLVGQVAPTEAVTTCWPFTSATRPNEQTTASRKTTTRKRPVGVAAPLPREERDDREHRHAEVGAALGVVGRHSCAREVLRPPAAERRHRRHDEVRRGRR